MHQSRLYKPDFQIPPCTSYQMVIASGFDRVDHIDIIENLLLRRRDEVYPSNFLMYHSDSSSVLIIGSGPALPVLAIPEGIVHHIETMAKWILELCMSDHIVIYIVSTSSLEYAEAEARTCMTVYEYRMVILRI